MYSIHAIKKVDEQEIKAIRISEITRLIIIMKEIIE